MREQRRHARPTGGRAESREGGARGGEPRVGGEERVCGAPGVQDEEGAGEEGELGELAWGSGGQVAVAVDGRTVVMRTVGRRPECAGSCEVSRRKVEDIPEERQAFRSWRRRRMARAHRFYGEYQ